VPTPAINRFVQFGNVRELAAQTASPTSSLGHSTPPQTSFGDVPQCVTRFLSARLPTSDHLQQFRRFCGRSAAKLLTYDEGASLPAERSIRRTRATIKDQHCQRNARRASAGRSARKRFVTAAAVLVPVRMPQALARRRTASWPYLCRARPATTLTPKPEGFKLSKSEVDYSRGMAESHCGKAFEDDNNYCRYFIPATVRISGGTRHLRVSAGGDQSRVLVPIVRSGAEQIVQSAASDSRRDRRCNDE
jgi:hypothetical protein